MSTTKNKASKKTGTSLTEIEIPTAEAWLASGAIKETSRGNENTYYIDTFDREYFCKNYPSRGIKGSPISKAQKASQAAVEAFRTAVAKSIAAAIEEGVQPYVAAKIWRGAIKETWAIALRDCGFPDDNDTTKMLRFPL
jgi:hypothetical protein